MGISTRQKRPTKAIIKQQRKQCYKHWGCNWDFCSSDTLCLSFLLPQLFSLKLKCVSLLSRGTSWFSYHTSFQGPIPLHLCILQCLCFPWKLCASPPLYLWPHSVIHLFPISPCRNPTWMFLSPWSSSNFLWQSGLASWSSFLGGISLTAFTGCGYLCMLLILLLGF